MKKNELIVLFFFVGIIFFPGFLINYIGIIETNFFGVFLVSASILFFSVFSLPSGFFSRKEIRVFCYVCLAILLHLLISHFLWADGSIDGIVKSVFSVFALFVVILSCSIVSRCIKSIEVVFFLKLIDFIFVFLVVLGGAVSLSFVLGWQQEKGMVFFTEPSHYALFASLFYCFSVLSGRKSLLWFFPLIAIAFLVENLTLLIGVAFSFATFFIYKKNTFFPALFFGLVAVFFFAVSGYDFFYFFDRLNISSESENTSVLTFISGYEQALIALDETSSFGYGFQRMGYINPRGELINIIADYRLGDVSSNLYDGGTFLAKIIVEFGGLGIVFFIGLMLYSALKLRRRDLRVVFFSLVLWMGSIYFLIRGSGYFTNYAVFMIFSIVFFVIDSFDKERYFKCKE